MDDPRYSEFCALRSAGCVAWVVGCVTLLGCGGDIVEPAPGGESGGEVSAPMRRVQRAVGAPVDGFPSDAERRVLYLTNRARTEPEAFNPDVPADAPYPPTPPLHHDLELARAARFHARHIAEASCWCESHASCCTLERQGDTVSCIDTPGGCDGTSASERVALWSAKYSGENMARGQTSAAQAVDGWIHSPGHWANMNSAGSGYLGAGQYATAWVQDFGRTGAPPPVAADGVHLGGGASQQFGITYYQPQTGGPRSVRVVVDRTCHDMDLAYGTTEHGAFETTVQLDPGCHSYFFRVVDGEGVVHHDPPRGSWSVAVGEAGECPRYRDARPEVDCSGPMACDTGDTRPCYTVSFDKRNVGKCRDGTQRCIGGEWQQECRLETLPDDEDVCGNDIDDDCDGAVDETCPDEEDAGAPDAGGPDMGSTAPDPGQMSDEKTCAVTAPLTPAPGADTTLLWILAALLAAPRIRCHDSGGDDR
jgi:hypothetical protein